MRCLYHPKTKNEYAHLLAERFYLSESGKPEYAGRFEEFVKGSLFSKFIKKPKKQLQAIYLNHPSQQFSSVKSSLAYLAKVHSVVICKRETDAIKEDIQSSLDVLIESLPTLDPSVLSKLRKDERFRQIFDYYSF